MPFLMKSWGLGLSSSFKNPIVAKLNILPFWLLWLWGPLTGSTDPLTFETFGRDVVKFPKVEAVGGI